MLIGVEERDEREAIVRRFGDGDGGAGQTGTGVGAGGGPPRATLGGVTGALRNDERAGGARRAGQAAARAAQPDARALLQGGGTPAGTASRTSP